ncbi:hypothetical protein [[Mycobacterium] vasticus]|uniref:Uncharacterized protein n=1 Tax=[Mycobacterium] vasticus TaxID=2875777 RepID=A0ABU5YW50_9MYCO|nr:hypothetical protein [Mycolicibacter sp. MYC017]MEB3069318.1 hypothetical protein [Mycolicibacter sp. MYC017]
MGWEIRQRELSKTAPTTKLGPPLGRRHVVNGPALAEAFRRAPGIDYARLRDDLDSAAGTDTGRA